MSSGSYRVRFLKHGNRQITDKLTLNVHKTRRGKGNKRQVSMTQIASTDLQWRTTGPAAVVTTTNTSIRQRDWTDLQWTMVEPAPVTATKDKQQNRLTDSTDLQWALVGSAPVLATKDTSTLTVQTCSGQWQDQHQWWQLKTHRQYRPAVNNDRTSTSDGN